MPSVPCKETEEDWVTHAVRNASGPKLPQRSHGPKLTATSNPLNTSGAQRPKPIPRRLSSGDFNRFLVTYWDGHESERLRAFARACVWSVEAFLRAEGASWGSNLNHSLTVLDDETHAPSSDIGLLRNELADIGLQKRLKPVCNHNVELRCRGELCEDDLGKLTLWLHWQMVAESVEQLVSNDTFWWQDGDWFLSVREADRVRKLRKRQLIAA